MDRQLHGGDTYGHPSRARLFLQHKPARASRESVQAALAGSVGDWDGYPDPLCRDLTAAIAAADGVPPRGSTAATARQTSSSAWRRR